MLTEVEAIQKLHKDGVLVCYCDKLTGEIEGSYLQGYEVRPDSIRVLEALNFLEDVSNERDLEEGKVYYRLQTRIKSMMNTIIKHKVLKLGNNYRGLSFLDLSKTALLLSHSTKGLVEFYFNNKRYVARLKIDLNFFENQYEMSKQIRKDI